MPRWVEMLLMATVGILLLGGILVVAKLTTRPREAAPVAEAPPQPVAGKYAPVAPPPREPPPMITPQPTMPRSELDNPELRPRTLERPETAAKVVVVEATPPAPPATRFELAPFATVALQGAVIGLTNVVILIARGEALTPTAEVKPVAGVQAGSKEELALLEAAKTSLEGLHQLRVRLGVAPAQEKAELDKLKAIVDQLPPETKKQVAAAFERGYLARLRGPGAGGEGVGAADPARAEAGKVDDTPNDVRLLGERVTRLRQRYGATGTEAPREAMPSATSSGPPAPTPSTPVPPTSVRTEAPSSAPPSVNP